MPDAPLVDMTLLPRRFACDRATSPTRASAAPGFPETRLGALRSARAPRRKGNLLVIATLLWVDERARGHGRAGRRQPRGSGLIPVGNRVRARLDFDLRGSSGRDPGTSIPDRITLIAQNLVGSVRSRREPAVAVPTAPLKPRVATATLRAAGIGAIGRMPDIASEHHPILRGLSPSRHARPIPSPGQSDSGWPIPYPPPRSHRHYRNPGAGCQHPSSPCPRP